MAQDIKYISLQELAYANPKPLSYNIANINNKQIIDYFIKSDCNFILFQKANSFFYLELCDFIANGLQLDQNYFKKVFSIHYQENIVYSIDFLSDEFLVLIDDQKTFKGLVYTKDIVSKIEPFKALKFKQFHHLNLDIPFLLVQCQSSLEQLITDLCQAKLELALIYDKNRSYAFLSLKDILVLLNQDIDKLKSLNELTTQRLQVYQFSDNLEQFIQNKNNLQPYVFILQCDLKTFKVFKRDNLLDIIYNQWLDNFRVQKSKLNIMQAKGKHIEEQSFDILDRLFDFVAMQDLVFNTLDLKVDMKAALIFFSINYFDITSTQFLQVNKQKFMQYFIDLIEHHLSSKYVLGLYNRNVFIIFLPQTSKSQSYMIAENLRIKVKKHNFPYFNKVSLGLIYEDLINFDKTNFSHQVKVIDNLLQTCQDRVEDFSNLKSF